jgi:hypothetical protein
MCKSVLRITGWKEVNAIVGTTDQTARQIFECANEELEELSQKPWPQLIKEHTFATVDGTDEYALPADFRVAVSHSAYQQSQYYSLRGSVSSGEWHQRKDGLLGNLDRWAFRIFYGADGVPVLKLAPTPSQADDLVIEYMSSNFARTSADAEIPIYASDSDVPKVPERLVRLGLLYRFRRVKGLDFSAELAAYNAAVNQSFSQYRAHPDIPIGGRPGFYDPELTHGYVPDTGFGV